MKQLFLCLLCAGFLLAANSAHAYAVYNHAGHSVCVKTHRVRNMGHCKFFVDAHSTHNGPHGASLDDAWFQLWTNGGDVIRSTTVPAYIPKGGFARVYNDHVEIWKHCDHCKRSRDFIGGYPFEKGDNAKRVIPKEGQ